MAELALTLSLGHTLHSVVSRQDFISRPMLLVPSLVVVPHLKNPSPRIVSILVPLNQTIPSNTHVEPKRTMTDSLSEISTQHGDRSGLVSWSFSIINETRPSGVSCAVSDKHHGGSDGSFGVGTDVGGDHDETESETDGLRRGRSLCQRRSRHLQRASNQNSLDS